MIIDPQEELQFRFHRSVSHIIRATGNTKISVNAMTAGLSTVSHVAIADNTKLIGLVKASSQDSYYVSEIFTGGKRHECTCDFNKKTKRICKHIFLVGLTFLMDADSIRFAYFLEK